ncbi:hypothetical protein [Flavobacterium channae]|uniref:hypothetical protein n=1 Tax=Flavobacterium channae TaxID=2897181 RepID=UPI001E4ED9B1|nr:hypothetical protein [Flavobacterium channae]UGS23499.1 hypothetical protein LOS89_12170 [Flavobacterium channae]
MDDLKERRLKSLDYRIQELENQPNYFKKYGLGLLLIGISVTIITPEYTTRGSKNLIYYFNYDYPLCYSVIALSYIVLCIIMLVTFKIQDKKKIKKLKQDRDFIDLFRD